MVRNNYQSEASGESKERNPGERCLGKEFDFGFSEGLETAEPGHVWGMRLPRGAWVRIDKTDAHRFHAAITLANGEEMTLTASSGAELAIRMRELVDRQPDVRVVAERRAVGASVSLLRSGYAGCELWD